MERRRLVLVHGYSASSRSFERWRELFRARGYDRAGIESCSYVTLTNEVSLADIAEGFDRALREQTGLGDDEPFDVMVHSTGMLVVRAWLTSSADRRARLKHLVGLAPATFGSPLAHKGRGWLGAIFLGNKQLGPDFLEAGDRILDGLELASPFTWELAHRDLIGETAFYGRGPDTPYAFVFCGTQGYGGILSLISDPGTDGTVRLAGAALNTRKIELDLTIDTHDASDGTDAASRRVRTAPWSNPDLPLVPIAGLDHGSILRDPTQPLIDLVMEGLAVESAADYRRWYGHATAHADAVRGADPGHLNDWQQFIVRLVDERGDGVPDYYLDIIRRRRGKRRWERLHDYRMKVHPYRADTSYRSFHIDLDSLGRQGGDDFGVRLMASSGSELVGYDGFSDDDVTLYVDQEPPELQERWTGTIDLSTLRDIEFFYPFTTTLLEIRLNREPLPTTGRNRVLWFDSSSDGDRHGHGP